MAVQAQYLGNPGFYWYGSQEWMDTNGGFCDFYLNLQQQQQQQQQPQQMQQQQLRNQQRDQNQCFGNSEMEYSSMAFSRSLRGQIEKQKEEIDRFIQFQNERLRSTLQEQRKQQLAILLRRIESKTQSLLRQKDEYIARAAKKTMELEDCLKRVEMENQAWQRVARENEAIVLALSNTLEQLRENVCCFSSGAEDAESCCEVDRAFSNRGGAAARDREEEAGREIGTEGEEQTKKMACKACNSRVSCVLFLPCRHLCSCKPCEGFLDSCPVCKSPKKASVEVFML
ncbi:PREDICTED: probable BOI-related E3 ubiquitin-protein ligase 2 [Nelumbo nucifera]|uniref:Probable BOI-related E3 ubiquitin-protein ligase 2 n=1 Tax=Nelumbo nucifera TaxID=4432 RepID=A0A1U8AGS7_NELNU|nr:PREDICTED: probable BOI-related E3 ubiquitin-protein ligase 2 [Nelumbo nucifera]